MSPAGPYPPPSFPLGPFRPSTANPILRPRGDGWESTNLYNPAAVVDGDHISLLYRAHGPDLVSRIGLATSRDGLRFERETDPVVVPEHDYESRGCEDPRISQIGDVYFGEGAIYYATSSDLVNWTPCRQDSPIYTRRPAPGTERSLRSAPRRSPPPTGWSSS
jgi:predicted GH43/DUF377 family glycosyl hydrolase